MKKKEKKSVNFMLEVYILIHLIFVIVWTFIKF